MLTSSHSYESYKNEEKVRFSCVHILSICTAKVTRPDNYYPKKSDFRCVAMEFIENQIVVETDLRRCYWILVVNLVVCRAIPMLSLWIRLFMHRILVKWKQGPGQIYSVKYNMSLSNGQVGPWRRVYWSFHWLACYFFISLGVAALLL